MISIKVVSLAIAASASLITLAWFVDLGQSRKAERAELVKIQHVQRTTMEELVEIQQQHHSVSFGKKVQASQ